MTDEAPVVLEARGLSKSYGGVVACADVNLDIRKGKLTAIVGDNGAGKSTLVKILTGAIKPDSGTLTLNGKPITMNSPLDARNLGIEAVYQELALAQNLDVTANLFLGREITKPVLGIPFIRRLDNKAMRVAAAEEVQRLKINLPGASRIPIGGMSGGQRQAVAIARAVHWSSDVVFMDEPTAALGQRESQAVLELVREVLDQGVAVVMISHILPHVLSLADEVVVMRLGRRVATLPGGIDPQELVALIVGTD